MASKRIGYARVSTLDQNTERQLAGIILDKVFTDKASGKDTNRPQLQAALASLREGDTLTVHSMDRLARNVDERPLESGEGAEHCQHERVH
jgi:DNA invertase Pin-like site-specific DNA recombinase